MGILYALAGSFRQQWKVSLSSQQHLDWLLGILPQIFIVLWMAGQSDDRTVFDYVAVGSLFWVLWTMTVFRIGSSLTDEFYEGTLEAGLTSRTPLMLIILGKAAAVMVLSLIASTLVMVVVLVVLQHWIDIASIPLLIVSAGFVTLALFATGFIFAPAMVLLQGRGRILPGPDPVRHRLHRDAVPGEVAARLGRADREVHPHLMGDGERHAFDADRFSECEDGRRMGRQRWRSRCCSWC